MACLRGKYNKFCRFGVFEKSKQRIVLLFLLELRGRTQKRPIVHRSLVILDLRVLFAPQGGSKLEIAVFILV